MKKTVLAAALACMFSVTVAQAQQPVPVTGSERLAWDMTTGTDGMLLSLAAAQALFYFPLVDVVNPPAMPAAFTGVTCAAGTGVITCSAPLMALTPGQHMLYVVASPPGGMPSVPSAPLSVIVIVRLAPPMKLRLTTPQGAGVPK